MNIRELHSQAMEQADLALVSKLKGDTYASMLHLNRAYSLEKQAASALQLDYKAEPSRSVLYRSAATLARDCGQLDDSRRLIYTALAGRPPKEIENELIDLLVEVHPAHHARSENIAQAKLLSNDPIYLKLSFTGGDMTEGVLPFHVFKGLVDETYGCVKRIYNPSLDEVTGFQYSEQALAKLLSIPVYTPEFASLTITIQRPRIDLSALKKVTAVDDKLLSEAFDQSTQKFFREVEIIAQSARQDTVFSDFAGKDSETLQIVSRLAPGGGKAFDTLSVEGMADTGEQARITVDAKEGGRIIKAADAIKRSNDSQQGVVVELNRRSNTFVLKTRKLREITCAVGRRELSQVMDIFQMGNQITVEGDLIKRDRRDYMFVDAVTLPNGKVIRREKE